MNEIIRSIEAMEDGLTRQMDSLLFTVVFQQSLLILLLCGERKSQQRKDERTFLLFLCAINVIQIKKEEKLQVKKVFLLL